MKNTTLEVPKHVLRKRRVTSKTKREVSKLTARFLQKTILLIDEESAKTKQAVDALIEESKQAQFDIIEPIDNSEQVRDGLVHLTRLASARNEVQNLVKKFKYA